MRNDVASLVQYLRFFRLAWCAQVNSVARSRLRLLSKSGVSFQTKLHLQKWAPCPVRLLACCRTKYSRHCKFDEMLSLRRELVVDCNIKYNHDLGGLFACTVPFLVHKLVLSNRSFAVSMTILVDLEVRWNKLVSCFSNSILLPTDYSLGFIYIWKSCPCGICVPSNSSVSMSKKTNLIDSGTMTVSLYCTNVKHYSILWLSVNDQVLQSTFLVPNIPSLLSTVCQTKIPSCCSISFMTTSMT